MKKMKMSEPVRAKVADPLLLAGLQEEVQRRETVRRLSGRYAVRNENSVLVNHNPGCQSSASRSAA